MEIYTFGDTIGIKAVEGKRALSLSQITTLVILKMLEIYLYLIHILSIFRGKSGCFLYFRIDKRWIRYGYFSS